MAYPLLLVSARPQTRSDKPRPRAGTICQALRSCRGSQQAKRSEAPADGSSLQGSVTTLTFLVGIPSTHIFISAKPSAFSLRWERENSRRRRAPPSGPRAQQVQYANPGAQGARLLVVAISLARFAPFVGSDLHVFGHLRLQERSEHLLYDLLAESGVSSSKALAQLPRSAREDLQPFSPPTGSRLRTSA